VNQGNRKQATHKFKRLGGLLSLVTAVLGLLLSWPVKANGVDIAVPNNLATIEGNINNVFPFSITGLSNPVVSNSMRYQQVFSVSEFASLLVPNFITHIAFRPDGSFGSAFSSTLSDIQINLSTTSFGPDGLNTTFATNVGADDTVVLNRGPLSLSSAFTGPAGGPKNFDIIIALTTPFIYDPSLGNLLLDVRNFAGGITTAFDAQQSAIDSVSRVTSGFGGSVGSISGIADTAGLVVQLTIHPIPEPATLLLLGSGLAGVGFVRRRKKA
jgi:hypothetical protein